MPKNWDTISYHRPIGNKYIKLYEQLYDEKWFRHNSAYNIHGTSNYIYDTVYIVYVLDYNSRIKYTGYSSLDCWMRRVGYVLFIQYCNSHTFDTKDKMLI